MNTFIALVFLVSVTLLSFTAALFLNWAFLSILFKVMEREESFAGNRSRGRSFNQSQSPVSSV